MTYFLICEGQDCNPSLRRVDEAVKREMRLDGRVIASDEMVAALRRLQHTPHVMSGPHVARCEVCQTERKYGNSQW